MLTRSEATSGTSARMFWMRAAFVAVLATAVLAMHALTGTAASGAEHAEMAHAMSLSTTSPAAEHVDARGVGSHVAMDCSPSGVCLSVVALGLLLLIASRAGRPLLARRRDSMATTLRLLLAGARLRDPPNLHSLSILRC